MNISASKLTNSIIAGSIAAVAFIVILTIVGDLYAPLKALLKDAHYHHWVGKGIWGSMLFAGVGVVYYIFAPLSPPGTTDTTTKLLHKLSWILISGTIILIAFFVYETFGHH